MHDVLVDEGLFAACLLGGALGDALGAPVEFLSLDEIRARHGQAGILSPQPSFGLLVAAVTDDTQLTLFTAEGLIRARVRKAKRGEASDTVAVRGAYARWLETQEGRQPPPRTATAEACRDALHADGWLVDVPALWSRRLPGATCCSALRSQRVGTPSAPLNDSKGCGAVMRSAPVGLACEDPFRSGCELGALTHGHPTGFLSAGAFARIVRGLADGEELSAAVLAACAELREWPGHEETLAALQAALDAARWLPASAETVERLGRGWTGEEALAIAVFCALAAEDFEQGVRLAVNHSGDSDSTGALAGSLLGLRFGLAGLPAGWLSQLELRDVVDAVARDLARVVHVSDEELSEATLSEWLRRYPAC